MSEPALLDEIALLTALDAPVGFEEPVLAYVREQLTACCERVEIDVRGNVYGHQPAAAADAPLVMVTAHADEIGFMVTTILPGGFLRFTKLGHPTDMVLPGQQVRMLTSSGPIPGVIGVKPGHILSPEQARQTPALRDMYIDVGAVSAEEAAGWGIEPGTPAVFVGELTATRNPRRLFGKSVDNRMGVAAVLQVARRLVRERPAAAVTYAIVVEEEVGLRGAEVAAAHLQPDVVLALDTVPAGGTPDLSGDELPWEIGRGPLLKVRETKGLSTHRPLRELIRRVAESRKIPYQLVVDTAGITDATSAQQAGGQIAAAVIGLARRYSHSAVELFDLGDVEALVELVSCTVGELRTKSQLLRL